MMDGKPRVALVKCGDYDEGRVEAAVGEALELVGGIGRFVAPGGQLSSAIAREGRSRRAC